MEERRVVCCMSFPLFSALSSFSGVALEEERRGGSPHCLHVRFAGCYGRILHYCAVILPGEETTYMYIIYMFYIHSLTDANLRILACNEISLYTITYTDEKPDDLCHRSGGAGVLSCSVLLLLLVYIYR